MSATKTVLITGANRGIGYEIARSLAASGFRVIMTSREAGQAQEAAARVERETGGEVTSLPLDVSESSSIKEAAKAYGGSFPSLDVLINNAGIYEDEDRSILEVSTEEIMRSLATNTLGPLMVTRFFRPFLEASSRGGRVINLSSGLGQLNDMADEAPAYSISKTALNAVTRQLSASLTSKGIAVNSVCPGWVRTEMGGPGAARSVEEGADTVVWLAAEAPQKLTGQFLRDRQSIDW